MSKKSPPPASQSKRDWLKISVNLLLAWLLAVGLALLAPAGGLVGTPLSFLSDLCADVSRLSFLLSLGGFSLAHLLYRTVGKTNLPKTIIVLGQLIHPERLSTGSLWVGWLLPWVLLAIAAQLLILRPWVCPPRELDMVFKIQQRPGAFRVVNPDDRIEIAPSETMSVTLTTRETRVGRLGLACKWTASDGLVWTPSDCTTLYDAPPQAGEATLSIETMQENKLQHFTLNILVR